MKALKKFLLFLQWSYWKVEDPYPEFEDRHAISLTFGDKACRRCKMDVETAKYVTKCEGHS